MEIRTADTSDAGRLAEIYRNAYRENRELGFPAKAGSASEGDVAEWIREFRLYVAIMDEDIVGGVRLEDTDPNRVKLSRLGVPERWQSEGIGSRLLEHAESAMRECGYSIIWLTTPEGHPYLPEFYRQRGYEETDMYPLDYRNYDEIVMEKQL